MAKTKFFVATEEDIIQGKVTDKYFERAREVLEKKNMDAHVVKESCVKAFPDARYRFGILNGVYDAVTLLAEVAERGRIPVNVYAMDEGEIFFAEEPVFQIECSSRDFMQYETAILGFLSQATGVSSKAARVRIAAGDKYLTSFGTRRMHPILAPMIERAVYIGGFDAVSNVAGAEKMGKQAEGTMPHELVLVSNPEYAFRAFDEVMPPEVKRIMLSDTSGAVKEESLLALRVLGKNLYGIRIDSQDRKKVGKEIRWELDTRDGKHVKLFASGGLDEYEVANLGEIYDGFGVGTKIANAPVYDFALKVVEVDGKPKAKFGNRSGGKQVYRKNYGDIVALRDAAQPEGYVPLLKPYILNGETVREFESIDEIRGRVMRNLKLLPQHLKVL
jgi:nicotinate phosphoribosyltransferase